MHHKGLFYHTICNRQAARRPQLSVLQTFLKIDKLLVLASLVSISAPSAEAKQMYPQRYDARYIMTTEHSPVEIRTSSDGKGRLRSEVSNSGLNRSITLTDYVGGVVYRISTAPRMVFKAPLKEPYEGDFDDAAAKKKNAVSLGRKSIKGRMCLGWAFKQDGVAESLFEIPSSR